MVVVDNVLGPEHVTVMCRETIVVTDRGLLRGSTSTYSMVASETFEERYGDESDISASVLTPEIASDPESCHRDAVCTYPLLLTCSHECCQAQGVVLYSTV